MSTYQYCTKEWLDESAKRYTADPRFQKEFEKITPKPTKYVFRVKAEPAWGIDRDLLFGAVVEQGKLLELGFFSEENARKDANFILSATPQEWKRLLRKETKFIAVVMLKKVSMELGDFPGLLKIAPHGDAFVDALTQVPIQFQDEMSVDELAQYKDRLKEFRNISGV
jgi:putative sterol carrier protein